jgi:hypothetical protein
MPCLALLLARTWLAAVTGHSPLRALVSRTLGSAGARRRPGATPTLKRPARFVVNLSDGLIHSRPASGQADAERVAVLLTMLGSQRRVELPSGHLRPIYSSLKMNAA